MNPEFTVDQNPRIFEKEIPGFSGSHDHDHDSFHRIANVALHPPMQAI